MHRVTKAASPEFYADQVLLITFVCIREWFLSSSEPIEPVRGGLGRLRDFPRYVAACSVSCGVSGLMEVNSVVAVREAFQGSIDDGA